MVPEKPHEDVTIKVIIIITIIIIIIIIIMIIIIKNSFPARFSVSILGLCTVL